MKVFSAMVRSSYRIGILKLNCKGNCRVVKPVLDD